MDISIVVRTLNEAKWLPELLQAIADQELGNWTAEVVLVDSGSTDATLDVARSFGCHIVTIPKAQFTFGRSLNVGCDVASGRILVFISGHCVQLGPDWLVNLFRKLDHSASCSY